jgi:hypothetical protein
VLSAIEGAGLKASDKADRRTLIRRVAYDLIGLPPKPAEIESFLADESPTAYARIVDRLLANPHFGERWGRHWLDVVRYADSLDARGSGQPGDILDAWRYRDWVVKSLNDDLPYDSFMRLQLAGDIRPPGADEGSFDRDGVIASTMLAIGNWGNGDADKDKILTDIADDQVDVVSKAFLGLTVACARCHDHKFDPIRQDDYYGLAGIFFSTHILPKLTPKGAGETIIRVPLASPAELAARQRRDARIAELKKLIEDERRTQYGSLASQLRPQAPSYILAALDYLSAAANPMRDDLAAFAATRGLHAFALRSWVDALGGGEVRLFSERLTNVGGDAFVSAWKSANSESSATANASGETKQILTFHLPARSISVHPGSQTSAVISWSSPIAGAVRIGGRVADGDGACGDGVRWSISHRTAIGVAPLASGELANAGAMAFGQGAGADALSRVEVRIGDKIELVIDRKGEYSCDTTAIELFVSAWNGAESWDATRDCVEDFLSANPHADRQARAGVWSFGETTSRQDAAIADPNQAAWTRWRAAIASNAPRSELETVAVELAAALAIDGPTSPFWIKSSADESALTADGRETLARLTRELAQLEQAAPPPLEFANAPQEGGVPESPHAGAHDVAIHLRGRYDRLGPMVPRHVPAILGGGLVHAEVGASGRLELAGWLANERNPLPARVIANRLWQHHFGAGIVRTPSNFGKLGDRPSHPALLDTLALELRASGWRLKDLHRRIVHSSTYKQSSTPEAATIEADPDNRLFGRMPRRRLEAEIIRDNLLAASGEMDEKMGGVAVRDFDQPRRGIYIATIRSDRATFGSLFDQADSTAPVDARIVSTVAPQALFLMNSPFALARSETLAKRILAANAPDDRERVMMAYRLLFGRAPDLEELRIGLETLKASGETADRAWAAYCQVLLCTNEYFYID